VRATRSRLLLALATLSLASAVAHAQAEVISHRADAVSITLYRDLFALVTETRMVELPDGATTLSFEGVVETLLPASAVVAGTGRALEERNYDYDALTPNRLFEKSVGRDVVLTRTLPGSGKVVRAPATIVAANANGITLHTADGLEALHCSGLPEQVTFARIPDGLQTKPKLSVRLGPGPAGKHSVRLSYLAHGFTWKSDYVARLDATGNRADLKGWLTLTNSTNAIFRDAQVQVVAGRLNLLGEHVGGTSKIGDSDAYWETERREARENARESLANELANPDVALRLMSGCEARPMPEERMYRRSLEDGQEEIVVTGMRAAMHSVVDAVAARENLADYQLYRLPWPTDLNARQTKQAVFLDKPRVKVDRFYRYFIDARRSRQPDEPQRPRLVLGLDNRKSAGLGEPLPEGVLRLYEPGDGAALFSGEAQLEDSAVGVPLEVELAGALDLAIEYTLDRGDEKNSADEEIAALHDVRMRIANAKEVPVTVEIRQPADDWAGGTTIAKSNRRATRKSGDHLWRVRVPANADAALTYGLRVPKPPKDDAD
jgi:hypothetical protein